ncbi:MAG: carboxypeptidase-like regulatory domain-containing protein, partial [Bacteroidales bacterium]|nr:carboxypeptidase-like regulatory domain-containing protein [Bacteroidales bacterium]
MIKLKTICIVLLLVMTQQLKAQDDILGKRISIELVNGTIVDLLNAISEKYKIYFSYDPDILSTAERKDYKFENTPLKDILIAVLNENIAFKTINSQVILYQKNTEEIKKQTLRGTVIDKDTRSPVIGAAIVIKNTEPLKGTITDQDGNYSIKNVPVGRQTLYVSSIGYKPVNLDNIMLLSAKEKILTIEMEESVSDIEEVIVYAYARKEDALNEMATVGARSFSVEETEKYAGSWGDPSRMAINFAGVVMAGDERNDIVIRGNSPSALIWQLEGLPIPSPN